MWLNLFWRNNSFHWESTPFYGGSETRRLVRDRDGKILITIVHGKGPNDEWTVCLGLNTQSFTTELQAKKFAEEHYDR